MTWIHRYTGLTLALFLIVAGLSGATLVFYDDLDALTFPALDNRTGAVLAPTMLADRVERAHPELQIMYLPLRFENQHALKLSVAPRHGGRTLSYDEIFVDPRTSAMLGTRNFEGPVRSVRDLMPFLFRLHYTLALGATGAAVMGWIALIWTIDCFVGFYLTLPVAAGRGWLARWAPAWRLRRRTTPYKLNFDLHRMAGLWLWPMLFVMAWSSVGMNLQQVYSPVMHALLPMSSDAPDPPAVDRRRIGWGDALAIGRGAMTREAARRGIAVREEVALRFVDWAGEVRYITRTSIDAVEAGKGETAITINPRTGRIIRFLAPETRRAGDVIGRWLGYLHEAQVGGRAYAVLLALTGIVMAVLSITGIVIWGKKGSARRRARLRQRALNLRRSVSAPLADQPVGRLMWHESSLA